MGLFGSILGHVGDGNFHETILYDGTNLIQRKAVEKCVHRMVERAIEMDGTCTVRASLKHNRCLPDKTLTFYEGEHSIGMGKKEFLEIELDANTIGVMRSIKRSLDPYWILNPGKIFDYV